MKANFMLLMLVVFSNIVFAQSSKYWTVYSKSFNYTDGKYETNPEKLISKTAEIASLIRLDDGNVLAIGYELEEFFKAQKVEVEEKDEKKITYISLDFKKKPKEKKEEAKEEEEDRVNLASLTKMFFVKDGKLEKVDYEDLTESQQKSILSYYSINSFDEVDDLNRIVFTGIEAKDGLGNVYRPVENGVMISKSIDSKVLPLPAEYAKEWSLYNLVGLEKGFIAGLRIRHIRSSDDTYEYRFVHFDGEKFNFSKLPKAPGEHDKNPLMAAAMEKEYILSDIYKDKKGNYWVTGKNKVFLFKDGQLEEQFSVKEGDKSEKSIGQIAVNSNGKALISYGNIVYVYDVNTKKKEYFFNKKETIITGGTGVSTNITAMDVDSQDKFVITSGRNSLIYGSENRSHVYFNNVRNGALIVFDYPNFNKPNNGIKLLNMISDVDQNYLNYFGQDQLKDELGNEYVLGVGGSYFNKIDKEGKLTTYKIEDLTKEAGYRYPDFKIGNKQWSLDKKTGTLYFTTTRKYTFKMNADGSLEQLTFTLDKKLGGKSVKYMAYDYVNDALWLVTGKGYVYHPMNGGEIKYYTKKETGLGTGYGLFQLRTDDKGTLWVSNSKGLGEFNKDGFKIHANNAAGYLSNFVIQDVKGTTTFVGLGGAYQIDGDNITEVISFASLQEALNTKFPDQDMTNFVKTAAIDKENNIWVATNDDVIGYYNGTEWALYSSKDFLGSEQVYSIFSDSKDRINIVLAPKPAPLSSPSAESVAAAEAKKTVADKYQELVDASLYFKYETVLIDKSIEN